MTKKKPTLSEKAKKALILASNKEHDYSDHFSEWKASRMDAARIEGTKSVRGGILKDTESNAYAMYTDDERLERRYTAMYRIFPWKAIDGIAHILSSVQAYIVDPERRERMLDATLRTPMDNWHLWKRVVESTYTQCSKMPPGMGSAILTYATFEEEVDDYVRNVYGYNNALMWLNEEKKVLEQIGGGGTLKKAIRAFHTIKEIVEELKKEGQEIPEELAAQMAMVEGKASSIGEDDADEDTEKQVALRLDMMVMEAMLYHAGVYSTLSSTPLYDPEATIEALPSQDISPQVEESNAFLGQVRDLFGAARETLSQDGDLLNSTGTDHRPAWGAITEFVQNIRETSDVMNKGTFPLKTDLSS